MPLQKICSHPHHLTILCGVFFGCFIVAIYLEPYLRPFDDFSGDFSNQFEVKNITISQIFNLSTSRSDMFEIIGDIRIHANSSTISVGTCSSGQQSLTNFTVLPYTRKLDPYAMKEITTLKVTTSSPPMPTPKFCNKILSNAGATPTDVVPAIIFSNGGYTGNTFHDFADFILPLYYTSHQFNRSVLFLVTDAKPDWLWKYKLIFRQLSQYDLVAIKGQDRVFCFNRVIVGLKMDENGQDFMVDDPTIMVGFRKALRAAYSLRRHELVPVTRPRMLIVSRRVARRRMLNERAVADMAQDLGFDVVLEEMSDDVSEVARLVNSFDVLVGVHGAGLSNIVFLPENASVVQIIPFGLVNVSRFCFKYPSEKMKLRYLEYTAGLNESTLPEKYSSTEVDYANPDRMWKKGFSHFRRVYLDSQDVNIDLNRFRITLVKTLELFQS